MLLWKKIQKTTVCIASNILLLFSSTATLYGIGGLSNNTPSLNIAVLESEPTPVDHVQMTFAMINPLAVEEGHIGDILKMIEQAEFKIIALKMRTIPQEEAKRFYAEHASKPFFTELVEAISSGPIVTMVLQKPNAIAAMRQLIGATNPSKASPGTIRYIFGKNMTDNAIHSSDGPASAEREISFFFSQEDLIK